MVVLGVSCLQSVLLGRLLAIEGSACSGEVHLSTSTA